MVAGRAGAGSGLRTLSSAILWVRVWRMSLSWGPEVISTTECISGVDLRACAGEGRLPCAAAEEKEAAGAERETADARTAAATRRRAENMLKWSMEGELEMSLHRIVAALTEKIK